MNPSKESQICAPGTEAQSTVMPGSRSRIMRILGFSSLLLMAAEGCATLSAKSDSVLDTIQRQNDIAQKMGGSICMDENKTCVINCGINEMETFLTSDLVGINRTKLPGAEMEDFKNEPLVTDKDDNVTMYVGCVKSVVKAPETASIPTTMPTSEPTTPLPEPANSEGDKPMSEAEKLDFYKKTGGLPGDKIPNIGIDTETGRVMKTESKKPETLQDYADINKAKSHDFINKCYLEQKKKFRKLKGELTAKITISKKGYVTKVELHNNRINNIAIENCVESEVYKWRFSTDDDQERPLRIISVKFNFPL